MFWYCQFDCDAVLSGFHPHKRRSLKGMLRGDNWDAAFSAVQHLLSLGLIRWETWSDDVYGDHDILVAV